MESPAEHELAPSKPSQFAPNLFLLEGYIPVNHGQKNIFIFLFLERIKDSNMSQTLQHCKFSYKKKIQEASFSIQDLFVIALTKFRENECIRKIIRT
jgi:hypothetical protein